MPYYALLYEAVDDFIARRTMFREEHLGLARAAYDRGELVLAGALADPPDGALLIFQSDSPAAAENFAKNDPYVKNGLITKWTVRNWTVVVGNQEPRKPALEKAPESPPEMIARVWMAHTTPALSDSYLQHFEIAVRPKLRKIGGFLGATVGLRPSPGSVEILVTTYWQSFEAIDAFAGSDREGAVVAAEAAALLTDYDRRVRHYEIASSEFPAAR